MKQQYDIDEIKMLLEAYYDGKTSIGQEKLLCDFFGSACEIPEDLEADRQLFNALCAVDLAKVAVPEDLKERITTHIGNLESRERRSGKGWIKRFAVISVAASVILIIALGLRFISVNDNKEYETEQILAEVENPDAAEGYIVVTQKIEPQEEQSLGEKAAQTTRPKRKKQVKRQRVVKANQLKSVSDEQIAYENTERALMLLSEKLNIAHDGISKTQSTINEVNNTIIDII